jgi:prevent-host-death family protein
MATTSRVGVRELRQNLSVYLRRIARGDRFEITERGRRVALLVPLSDTATPLQRLVAAGLASAPEGDLLELGLPPGRVSRTLSEAVLEGRDDRALARGSS